MKKLTIITVVLAILCSAMVMAADLGNITWTPLGTGVTATDNENGGTVLDLGADGFLYGLQADVENPWLYNSNDLISVSVDGFKDTPQWAVEIVNQYTNYVKGSMDLYNGDTLVASGTVTPASAEVLGNNLNGTYVYSNGKVTAGSSEFNVVWSNEIPAGTPIDTIKVYLDPDVLSLGLQILERTEQQALRDGRTLTINDPKVEVPEPATYAYAAMGLVSVLGLKRRVRK